MNLYSAEVISVGKERADIKLSSGQIIHNFHPQDSCYGIVCPVHKPSDHAFRDLPLAFTGTHMVRIISNISVNEILGIEIPQLEGFHSVLIDPDDFNFSLNGIAILRNSGICRNCSDHIVSKFVHDYKVCSCGESSVDGGSSYLKRSGNLLETSIVFKLSEEDESAKLGVDD